MRSTAGKRILLAAGLAGIAAVGSLFPASAASAGPSCASGYHCVFITAIGSAQRSYFDSDNNFANDVFAGTSVSVNDNTWSASNSSNANRESHYYYHANRGGGRVFCINPGSYVTPAQLTTDGVRGNGIGQRDEASSLAVTTRTSVRCF